jgi:hypothetical protein
LPSSIRVRECFPQTCRAKLRLVSLIEEKKSHKDFYDFAKKLVKNPQMRIDMGEALYETVKDKYNLNNVSKKRAQAYKSLF